MKKILILGAIIVLVIGGFWVIRHRDTASSPAVTYAEVPSGSAYTPGTYSGTLATEDGRTRTYIIHIPTDFSPSKTYPLVMLFHGGGGTAPKILEQTHFDDKADAEGFILVAPESTPGTNWNDGRGTTDAEQAGVDDVAFVRQLIADLELKLPIDKMRIYSTGPSNGGMMSERLGCEASDIFAAIGPDVGPIPAPIYSTCKPGPIAVVGIQGGADPFVPVGGGTLKSSGSMGAGGTVTSAAQTMTLWASANHCSATPTITHLTPSVDDGTSVDTYTYTGCTSGKDVVYYIVQGMGHGWPPENGRLKAAGSPSGNINATDVMWDFFATHTK